MAPIIEKARSFGSCTADLTMCVNYFEVGRMIVEEEQGFNESDVNGNSVKKNDRKRKNTNESNFNIFS